LAILSAAYGQDDAKYSHEAQAALIPEELGEVYLGMPFKEFAANFDFAESEVHDTRFGPLPVTVKLAKGPVRSVFFKVHGLTQAETAALKTPGTTTVDQLDPKNIPDNGFVYEISLTYEPGFDLHSYVIKKYGDNGDVRKSDDPYHMYDIQWFPKTSDGLAWLIRVFHTDKSPKTLRLIGRIPGTEWEIEEFN